MPGTLPNIVGVSTPLSFPVIFEALAYCYYDSHFTDVRTERLSNLPKVTQQSHKLNLGSRLPRLCAQPLCHHCFSISLHRKHSLMAMNSFNYNRKKYRWKEGKQSPSIPLSYFSGDFSLCAYIYANSKREEHKCASKDPVRKFCPKDKKSHPESHFHTPLKTASKIIIT